MTLVIAERIKEHKKTITKYSWIVGILLVFYLLFRDKTDVITIVVLILIGALSILYKLFITTGIGLELILFVTVIGGMKFGSVTGAVIGVLATILGYTLSLKITKQPLHILGRIVGVVIVGIISGFVSSTYLFLWGMIATALFLCIIGVFNILLGGSLGRFITYAVTYIMTNFVFFKVLGPIAVAYLF